MLHPLYGKRDPYALQMEELAFPEMLVLVCQITWRHFQGDLYLPSFLRSFSSSRKASICNVVSVCPRVSARLPKGGYL
jgi:hypothetical protein